MAFPGPLRPAFTEDPRQVQCQTVIDQVSAIRGAAEAGSTYDWPWPASAPVSYRHLDPFGGGWVDFPTFISPFLSWERNITAAPYTSTGYQWRYATSTVGAVRLKGTRQPLAVPGADTPVNGATPVGVQWESLGADGLPAATYSEVSLTARVEVSGTYGTGPSGRGAFSGITPQVVARLGAVQPADAATSRIQPAPMQRWLSPPAELRLGQFGPDNDASVEISYSDAEVFSASLATPDPPFALALSSDLTQSQAQPPEPAQQPDSGTVLWQVSVAVLTSGGAAPMLKARPTWPAYRILYDRDPAAPTTTKPVRVRQRDDGLGPSAARVRGASSRQRSVRARGYL